MILVNKLENDILNESVNNSYKQAFNNTINELFTTINETSLVIFKLGSFILCAQLLDLRITHLA